MTRLTAAAVLSISLALPRTGRADDTKTAPPAADTAVLVEAVRALAVQQLYQTYQNLESFAAFRFLGMHEAGELARMLGSAVESADEADRQLARVAAVKGLPAGQAAALARLRKIAGRLKEQGVALQAFWDTGVGDHWKTSEEARKAAWVELEDVLELKKGTAPPPREPGKKK